MSINPHDWHKRPAGAQEDPCPVCGCPAAGTRKKGVYHRATLDGEGLAFRFILRKPSPLGWQQKGLCPRPAATTPASEAAAVPAAVNEALGPGDTTLDLMARAAMLVAIGKTRPQIEKAMKLPRRAVQTWSGQWRRHWKALCDAAEAQLLKAVKAQIGTVAILADVDAHLSRAEAAERIARRDGGALFPARDKPTVCTFFESYVLPVCLRDARPVTVATYRNALRLWAFVTGDPPLEAVTAQTMALFRDALSKRRGKQPFAAAAADTVASRLRHVQTVLDKAGPAARRNRDATGLLAVAPWIRPPRTEQKLPRVIAPELFKLVYDATAGMDVPAVPGIKAPAWWKALLVVTYNTQLRRRTLFEMRMDEIDWKAGCLRLPAERMKAGRPLIVHLNAAAMQALRSIRTERELVFPLNARRNTFHDWFHRLQDSAGIPSKDHFGLHAIRKTAATVLAAFSPQAAQLALGHKSLATTMNSYINPAPIVGPALDAMPQPFGLTP